MNFRDDIDPATCLVKPAKNISNGILGFTTLLY